MDESKRTYVTDYLQGLPEGDLQQIAADYLGCDSKDMNSDTSQQWVDCLSQAEVADIWESMQCCCKEDE